jgi:ABC-type dipeptide/oligopeptide/nickel transport system permease component
LSKYVLKRLLQLVPVLFFVSLFVFLIIHFIPGDPVEVMLGEDDAVASQELYDALRKRLGLDAPIYIQYLRWMGNVLRGNLGRSMQTGEPVWDMGHLILPSIVLGTAMASSITRFVRAEMLEQLRLDYVRTAKAKGLPPRMFVCRHVLKNSLLAATTAIGLQVGRLFGGSTVVETIFSWPGVALLVLESVYARDYPLLQGSVLFLAVTYVFVNLVVDIIYKWLDPRIQLG